MSTPARPAGPRLNLRGAVDLSGLARRPAPGPTAPVRPASPGQGASEGPPPVGPEAGQAADAPPQVVIDVTDQDFSSLVALSSQVPVVVDLWATWCGPCKQLSPILERLAAEYAGAFLLAKVDVDANPQIAGAFGVQSIPTIVAILKGQPVPLFQGAYPEPQVRQVIEELLRVAASNGVTGRVPTGAQETADPAEEDAEIPLPPLHAEAADALERDDLDGAADAYRRALAEAPADEDAKRGLALVGMLARTKDSDPDAASAAIAADPDDVAAHLVRADFDVLNGQVERAFADLVALVRRTVGDDRDTVRSHLVELFEVVGNDDPQVITARRSLAAALF